MGTLGIRSGSESAEPRRSASQLELPVPGRRGIQVDRAGRPSPPGPEIRTNAERQKALLDYPEAALSSLPGRRSLTACRRGGCPGPGGSGPGARARSTRMQEKLQNNSAVDSESRGSAVLRVPDRPGGRQAASASSESGRRQGGKATTY